jgi:hypothetical protein
MLQNRAELRHKRRDRSGLRPLEHSAVAGPLESGHHDARAGRGRPRSLRSTGCSQAPLFGDVQLRKARRSRWTD